MKQLKRQTIQTIHDYPEGQIIYSAYVSYLEFTFVLYICYFFKYYFIKI